MEDFQVKDLTYFYPNTKVASIENINLTISPGDFILLIGNSGSGKSTLGKAISGIVPEFYGGKIKGSISDSSNVGMVFQDPEKQLVMDRVEREIAFGLENLGILRNEMKKRVMEALSFLNIWHLKDRKTYELSGGQKQKVAIGSTIAMGSEILVFDEPISQLDPAAASEILSIIKRLNESLGFTIILIEQHIDSCINLVDRVILMENGKINYNGKVNDFINWGVKNKSKFLPNLPKFFSHFKKEELPLNIKEGRNCLRNLDFKNKLIKPKKISNNNENIVSFDKVSFSYDKVLPVLKKVSLNIKKGDFFALLGENGSGKTTLLKHMTHLLNPDKGTVFVKGRVGYLSQNPNDYLFNDSVEDELLFTLKNHNIKDYNIDKILKDLDIYKHKNKNPRDLSGGERQRVALASVLVMDPEILILDEPTRGLDLQLKDKLGDLLKKLHKQGKTIILVTHDVEFIAKYAINGGLMFNGEIIDVDKIRNLLKSGLYYSTSMSHLFKHICESVITYDDAVEFIKERV